MAWLVRLVTPPGGLVLDPFAGSGTTAEACVIEGMRCVLIEKDPAYAALIRKRLRKDIQPAMFGPEITQTAPGHAGIPGSGPQAASGDRGAAQTSPAASGGC